TDVGCVRITERYLHTDPPPGIEIREAQSGIAGVFSGVAGLPLGLASRWVGVAGTFTTLSALAQELETYDPERLHNSVVTLERMRDVCSRLVGTSVSERRTRPRTTRAPRTPGGPPRAAARRPP